MFVVQLIVINLLFWLSVQFVLPENLILFCTLCVLLLLWLIFTVVMIDNKRNKILSVLEGGFRSLHDGDYSISLPASNKRQEETIINLFNSMTDKLRGEKQTLYQRELLLDKVVNSTDTVSVLIGQRNTVIFANIAAKHFFREYQIIGASWTQLCQQKQDLNQHLEKNNAIIQLTSGADSNELQSWHFSRYQIKLHGLTHQLMLLKPMTKELREQELKTWKKVVRVINHELNNSIAPISSMCHSGKILADKLNQPQLDRVFNTISNRIQKLSEFIQNYSRLARLSEPKKQPFDLTQSIENLQSMYKVELPELLTPVVINADAGQIEQLLINLVKNANEICDSQACQLHVWQEQAKVMLQVRDFGPGMGAEVMAKAFLPYYSTKEGGSGIGLSICKEVVDAHNGQIELNNHPDGGLLVTVSLPIASDT